MWWRMEKHGFVLLFGFVFVIVLEFFGVVFLLFFYFFWSRLLKRVRVQKVMYWQWVKVDCKEQCTQKESSKKRCCLLFLLFLFFSTKKFEREEKILCMRKKEERYLQFLGQQKSVSLTFQVEELHPSGRNFILCSPMTCGLWEIPQTMRLSGSPLRRLFDFYFLSFLFLFFICR